VSPDLCLPIWTSQKRRHIDITHRYQLLMSSLYLFITDHTDHTDLTIGPWPSCQGERFSWVQAPCPSTCWEHPPGPSHRCWPSGSPSALIRAPGTKWRRFFCLWGGKHPEVCVCGALPKTKTYRCLDQNYTLQWFAPRFVIDVLPLSFRHLPHHRSKAGASDLLWHNIFQEIPTLMPDIYHSTK
jgi:hypothetical protein